MAGNSLQEPVTYTCALCDSEDGVRLYYNECQENSCERCKEAYTCGKKTKIVSIGEANPDPENDKPVPDVCKLHPGKLCDLYCSDCDVLLCRKCLSKYHKRHHWKPFEEEYYSKRQYLINHFTAISDKIEQFKNETLKRDRVNAAFTGNFDTMRKEINSQRIKLKEEVDSIADAILAELSSLEKEESTLHEKDCERSEKKVEELSRLLEEMKMTKTVGSSLFETEKSLRTILPQYDVTVKCFQPKQPRFMTGSIDRAMLTKMIGEIHSHRQYEKMDIDRKHVHRLSKFTVIPNKIFSICPADNNHVWLSIHQYKGLVLVNKEGVVIETVKLDFCPFSAIMLGTTYILMTSYSDSTLVYKLSLHNKQVTTFADIKARTAYDISINEGDEVFVSTGTPGIVVLNQSGRIVRKVICGMNVWRIACLSPGEIAVSDFDDLSIITDSSDSTKCLKWSGELQNGQTITSRELWKMSCDNYDRLFIPDNDNNQVYVLQNDGTQATCLLDQKHGVIRPTAVSVDMSGKVWIGCEDGTVHVMGL